MVRSHLRLAREKQARKTLVFSIIGIIIVVIFMIFYGIPLIVRLSLFVEKNNDVRNNSSNAQNQYILPPQLEPTLTATNSAMISISGVAQKNQKIFLYVNNEKVDETFADDNGKFFFDNVLLQEGDNEIFVRASVKAETSGSSNRLRIKYLRTPPSLSIDSPYDGQVFGKDDNTIVIKGKTDNGVKVTVNGFWAVMKADGSFEYLLPLAVGENTISVIAQDEAGNITDKSFKVRREG